VNEREKKTYFLIKTMKNVLTKMVECCRITSVSEYDGMAHIVVGGILLGGPDYEKCF